MNGDQLELFRKLTAGIKFDVKRFRKDFEALGLIKPKRVDDAKEKETSPKNEKKRKRKEVVEDDGKRRKKKKVTREANGADDLSKEEMKEAAELSNDSDEELQPGLSAEGKDDEEKDPNWKLLSRNQKKKIKRKKKKNSSQLLAQMHTEEMNHVRNQHKIHVYGTDLPDPVSTFQQLQTEYGVHEQIQENVRQLGFKEPTPIQMQVIPIMMKRRNVMACAPTGSGKTAAFILPILHHLKEPRNCGTRALVLAPTRELAKQIFREFHKFAEGRGFRIQYVNKASPSGAKLKKCDVLVTTPNRLVFMLKQDPPQIDLTSVEWMIVDESDKLFEDGKSGFRNQLAEIYKACDSASVRRGMFSATFAEDVQEWCRLNLDDVAQVYIGTRNTASSTVEQKLVFTGGEDGKLFEIRQMVLKGLLHPPVLIFVQSKERAKQLYFELFHFNIKVDVIHADKTPLQRDNVVRAFREGKIWVLICTELMGRGIDFKGINLVINYDFPTTAISYIHRIGRTGRAGQPGQAITFFTLSDQPLLRSIANVMKEAGCEVPDFLLKQGKPNKNVRKKMARQQVKRAPISRAYKKDRSQRKRRRQLKAKVFKQGDGKSKKTDSKDAESS